MENLIRRDILEIKPYIPGRPIDQIKREFNISDVVKLASNENPYPVSKKVINAIKSSISKINRYPDGGCFYLKTALSKKLNIKPENIIFGNGSDELIDIVIKTCLEDDEEIITADITFVEYEIVARANSKKVKIIPFKNYKYDVDAILGNITDKTKIIFIANPNNPTGTYINANQIEKLLSSIPNDVIVVFDEAYKEFVEARDFPELISSLNTKNIILLRTFSKAYGLAGLRIGFALLNEKLASYAERIRQPFNVNSLAQAAALAVIDDEKYLKETIKKTIAEKYSLYKNLDDLNLDYIKSEANFILIDLKRDCTEVFQKMLKYGIIVRDMKQYGLNTYIRVTIGTKKENKQFLKILKTVL